MIFLKFIIPQNYNFKAKLFGFIDYSTAILNIIWFAFVFCIINFIKIRFIIKIFILIIFCLPVLLFSIIRFNHENIVYVLIYMLKYIFSQKIYLYK